MRWLGAGLAAAALLTMAGCPLFPTSVSDAELKTSFERWNVIAVDTSGLDHKAVAAGENRVFGHQLGPVSAARAMAIVHIAMMDAVVAVTGGYESYTGVTTSETSVSVPAAIAQAGHDALVGMFPSHKPRLDGLLAEDLDAIADGAAKSNGVALGAETAAAILALREDDGRDQANEPYTFSDLPGSWRVDPLNPGQGSLGAHAYLMRTFVLHSASQFRVAPFPDMTGSFYAGMYDEVKNVGGDGVITPTARTDDQTEVGIYWAYDGRPSLCAPPRLYNQIANQIASDRGITGLNYARLMTVLHVAMADNGIAAWESKYYYAAWRPVTAIRESDSGTGPTGLGDGNDSTVGDETWTPLGAPLSNGNGPNFTPPFPAYPSGHASFGGAIFQVLRNYLGTDDVGFTFVSDELNGVTLDNSGLARPLRPRSFTSLSQAEEENGQSRIYLGIHFECDKTEGITLGNHVGNFVDANVYQPTE